jgi:methylmalonyl-CoA/ethylmalonyl-CoA epimerase
MYLHQVALPVQDLERATTFYRELLGVEPISVFDPPGLAFFPLGDTRLLLDRTAGTAATLYLGVDDVPGTVERLRVSGVEIVDEPHVIFPDDEGVFGPPADEWMAFFRDTEGNVVGLAHRVPRP